MTIQHLREVPWCPVCGGPCTEDFERGDYVFPERQPDPPPLVIEAPDVVVVDERIKYAPGDPIPYAEAVALGLVEGPPPEPPPKPKRGARKKTPPKKRARKPVEDRAHRKQEDRAKKKR